MKAKRFVYLALILVLLGCSFFNNLGQPLATDQPAKEPSQDVSTEGWLLPDPTLGLDTLDSYHQELTVSFLGTLEGTEYEWSNIHQHDVWKKSSADFWTLTMNETGVASKETLLGTVDQAHYSRFEAGAPCQVWWGEVAEGTGNGDLQQPAELLLAIREATDMGTETINDIPSRHYVVSTGQSGAEMAGDLWLAETGGYVIRYVLTLSGGAKMFGEGLEGQQRFEYNLSRINASEEVAYPEGCSAVLTDFPVMDGARSLHRLPEAVDYMVSAETAAIQQFYQDQLTAQSWTFVAAHDKDPKNVTLIFVNKDQGKAASILLSAREKGVWVSAILRPWQSSDT